MKDLDLSRSMPGVLNRGGIPHQGGILHLQGGNSVFRILFKM